MRIVIDFLNGPVSPATLALTRDLVRLAAGHDVWLAVPASEPGATDQLRMAFDGVLPRTRIRPFALLPDATLRPLLRSHALGTLAPDVVLVTAGAAPMGIAGSVPVVTMAGEDAPLLLDKLQVAGRSGHPDPIPPATRPRLAYISPLPPQKSGIADYSAELVPELAAWYDIDLIVDQDPVHDTRLAAFPQRSVAWFRAHAHEFQRVLYHFGNSPVHSHMFDLLREVPGIVVLHDFYLSNVLDYLEHDRVLPQGFLRALYESHGYTGLIGHRQAGRNRAVWKYPANRGVLNHATGIIVHSAFPQQLAADWYGPGAADDWRSVPLLRGKPDGATTPAARAAARTRLGLRETDYVVCTFGMLGQTKLNDELLDAFLASPLAADPHCRLVFVGQNDAGRYGTDLQKKIRASAAASRITITGFTDAATYADYAVGCDTAVQLRGASRGETSASVLDTMLYGAPTIVNAHGSTASIPNDLVLMLPDAFTIAELAGALGRLYGDPVLRTSLGARALAYVERDHAPAHAGRVCMTAIEHFAQRGAHAGYRALVGAAAAQCPSAQLPVLAEAIAFNRPLLPTRQLLVDVSALVQSDLKTGIQRVVRSILLSLVATPPAGFRVEPVFTTGGNRPYHYAHRFGMGLVGEDALTLEDSPVDFQPGDVFFGLDLFLSGVAQNEQLLLSMRDRGVEIYFCMYDLLPMLRPEVFPFGTDQGFGDFLRTVHKVSDGVLCISRAVADELATWFEQQGLQRALPLQLGWFHLGADINASAPSVGLPPDASVVLGALAQRPSFLVVGTVEPRKGHAQTLAAFELLWERGIDVNLVIVGKQGWMVETVAERMKNHPELGKRLFWLAGISDEMLLKLYTGAAALLAPSEGEGFGLPLIEAAQHGIPIIARSLPVFREVAGTHAHYFDGREPADLAAAVDAWLVLHRAGQAPASTGMPWLTWDQSALQAVGNLIRHRWYRTLPGNVPMPGAHDA
jgi:glycosyltransferase involved in cell wall biosynthesis